MNIDDLTLGQLKEIAGMKIIAEKNTHERCVHSSVGKICIMRGTASGIHVGTVEEVSNANVTLSSSRRLWGWKAKKHFTLSSVAIHGISEEHSRVSETLPVIFISDACELIPCSPEAIKTIFDARVYRD